MQVLLKHKAVSNFENEHRQIAWRHEIGERVREHLCEHQNHSLRPRQRGENNRISQVSSEDHAKAYLQHHVHAKAIITFLLDYIPSSLPNIEREFIVQVFTRFDGAEIIPEMPLIVRVDVDALITFFRS